MLYIYAYLLVKIIVKIIVKIKFFKIFAIYLQYVFLMWNCMLNLSSGNLKFFIKINSKNQLVEFIHLL